MTTRPSSTTDRRPGADFGPSPGRRSARRPRVRQILVDRIRPEDGLGRKRDRDGHRELRNSIEQFGVLTPVTVRPAPDNSGEYLLIKGQGRTLACRMLGLEKIPAIVARLRMRPIDRALLISRARQEGEETANVARRFGVTPSTVRRLEAQLDGASKHEVAALKGGNINLALHGVIAREVEGAERGDVVALIAGYSLRTREIQALFNALGWRELAALGPDHRTARLRLMAWACETLSQMEAGSVEDRLSKLAECLPLTLDEEAASTVASVR